MYVGIDVEVHMPGGWSEGRSLRCSGGGLGADAVSGHGYAEEVVGVWYWFGAHCNRSC